MNLTTLKAMQECDECLEPAAFALSKTPLCADCALELAEDKLMDMLEAGAAPEGARVQAFLAKVPEKMRAELKGLAAGFEREDA